MAAERNRIYILLFLFLFLSTQLCAQPNDLIFEHITVDDSLPENTVRVILQDHLGVMWEMNQLLFPLLVFEVLLLAGCSENSAMEPILPMNHLDAKWLVNLPTGDDDSQDTDTQGYNSEAILVEYSNYILTFIILEDFPDWPNAFFVMEEAIIEGYIITLVVSYSGGCENHEFRMACVPLFQESQPIQVLAQVFHAPSNDPCDQWVTETQGLIFHH